MATTKQTLILNHEEIERKITRMAFQIYESNVNESEIIIAGIAKNGYILAEKLANKLREISDLDLNLCEVKMDKKNPLKGVSTSLTIEDYQNKSLILVDDVLNSGSTLIYGVKHFLEVPLKKFQTAVLVDRSHKKFPVKADVKGLSLSTSLNETIKVSFGKTNKSVLVE
ncbi:phosphoribosyltransferase family protein [Mesonia sp.]|uniref:phosphoribosyltransferase family protein n=1 Tax=Mesonia sp. TaxID=1960830 RepID=UPI0017566050|nr:phosphoribosyltransferase family protein [Mesonia sp.]HIB38204.1 phosphoribosyltransferase [Mesonia sp.]HIO26677.1 phosphoribosyltransferase [Flavobacteriaceae bacterium]